jgi:putative tryptophan/tyrosine transport system substrate-binding protein
MKRREFIAALGGAAAWPFAVRAQQPQGVRRIVIIMSTAADDPESEARYVAFMQALQQSGWMPGTNLQVETRWVAGGPTDVRRSTRDLLRLSPEVVVAGGRAALIVPEIRQAGLGIPIVVVQAVDPVGSGYVASLKRPGGQVTGFMQLEYTLSGKWLQLLRDIAPATERVAVLREAGTAGTGLWAVIQAAASPLAVELTPVYTHTPAEIERGITAFASEPNGGLIVVVSSTATVHREIIVALAAKHRLPAIFPHRYFAKAGGLASYGPDLIDQYRRAAGYVDRILRGEKPSDLPVQAPTKYELVINLKTAKTLGITISPTLLARADEVIE